MFVRSLLIMLVLAAGCVHRPAAATLSLPPAIAAEYTPFLQPGGASLTGQAFLPTRGGFVMKGAGSAVTVDPLTTYSAAWYRQAGRDVDSWGFLPGDSLFARAHRQTTADADGRFRLTGLPAGRYLVRSIVLWEVPTGGWTGGKRQGGVVSAVVEVPAAGEATVILNSMEPAIP